MFNFKSTFSLNILVLFVLLPSCIENKVTVNYDTSKIIAPSSNIVSNIPQSFLNYKIRGENLIPNFDLKKFSSNKEMPENWFQDSWGDYDVKFSTLEDKTKERFLSVNISNYQNEGDSKWYFEPQVLKPGEWYLYTDESRSDTLSRMIVAHEDIETKTRYHLTSWQSHQSNEWKKDGFSFYVSPDNNEKVTVFHVLDRNGTLEIKNPTLTNIDPQPLSKPFISIAFDDIYASAANEGASELEKRGFRGSFYIVKNFTENTNNKYADTDMINSLIKSGHEIGSHSESHKFLSKLNSEDVEKDFKENISFLSTLGVKDVGMAYPYGDFSEIVENQSKKVHQYTRTSLFGLNDKSLDVNRLKIIPITSESNTEKLKQIIDDTERNSVWCILLFHDLGEDTNSDIYRTSLSQYIEILNYIKEKNITTLPVQEVIKQIK